MKSYPSQGLGPLQCQPVTTELWLFLCTLTHHQRLMYGTLQQACWAGRLLWSLKKCSHTFPLAAVAQLTHLTTSFPVTWYLLDQLRERDRSVLLTVKQEVSVIAPLKWLCSALLRPSTQKSEHIRAQCQLGLATSASTSVCFLQDRALGLIYRRFMDYSIRNSPLPCEVDDRWDLPAAFPDHQPQ